MADSWPYADIFVSPVPNELGVWMWEMPAGEGADIESFEGLKTWAETFCNEANASGCDTFTQEAVPMCLDAGGDSCRAAILVPTAAGQFAFVPDWTSQMLTNVPDMVRSSWSAARTTFRAPLGSAARWSFSSPSSRRWMSRRR